MHKYLYTVQLSRLDRFSAQRVRYLSFHQRTSSWHTNISAPLEIAFQKDLISKDYDQGNMLLSGSFQVTRIISNQFNPKEYKVLLKYIPMVLRDSY